MTGRRRTLTVSYYADSLDHIKQADTVILSCLPVGPFYSGLDAQDLRVLSFHLTARQLKTAVGKLATYPWLSLSEE